MTPMQWLIVSGIALVVGWIILQPQRWGKRDSTSNGSEGGFYAADGRRRDDDDDTDGDGDGGGDGGGGD